MSATEFAGFVGAGLAAVPQGHYGQRGRRTSRSLLTRMALMSTLGSWSVTWWFRDTLSASRTVATGSEDADSRAAQAERHHSDDGGQLRRLHR